MNISEIKAIARKAGFARRETAHEASSDLSGQAVAHLLEYISGLSGVKVISGYMPIRTEIDVLPAMEQLCRIGYRICVPVIVGAGLPLKFREWTPDCNLIDGPFGASVPEFGDWLEPDLLITPLVAFNMDGYRLGYGGGFYDRTLEKLGKQKPTLSVGYAYSGQFGDVPVEPTDQRLDVMVTEQGITQFELA